MFKSSLPLALISLASCNFSMGDDDNVVKGRLAEWADKLQLTAEIEHGDGGGIEAFVFLAPPGGEGSRCPHFDLRATINDQEVEVRRSLSISSGDNWFGPQCHWPAMRYTFAPEFVRAQQRVDFPDGLFYRDVVTRFDVTIKDKTGALSYRFARELPALVRGELLREADGPPRPGERLEVQFDPPPADVRMAYLTYGYQRYWLLPEDDLRPDDPAPVLEGVEQTETGFIFPFPDLADAGIPPSEPERLGVHVWPWSELPKCPFANCRLSGEVFAGGSSISVHFALPSTPDASAP
jgi:hypothetical protein